MNVLANLARNKGDPKIISAGPSSFGSADRLAPECVNESETAGLGI
jgi:hypothetical protein